mmetsp:Transcript_8387/g.14100  ORF Transcript_8387/g.14100 Transcript_8387/m.14100 type:complete len:296 (+) Transcript_8387:58-945(+)
MWRGMGANFSLPWRASHVGAALCASCAITGIAANAFCDPSESDRLARWHTKWESGQLGWHKTKPHDILRRFMDDMLGPKDSGPMRVLFPLCGKSVDLGYLARRGHDVVGVEGIPRAIDELLDDYGEELAPGASKGKPLPRLRVGLPGWAQQVAAPKDAVGPPTILRVVQGDFVTLSPADLGRLGIESFDACFDRGSLVAVAPADRGDYVWILTEMMATGGRILLVAVEHDAFSGGILGPPYEVSEAEVHALFGGAFEVRMLSREDRMEKEPIWKERGALRFEEVSYLLTKRQPVA